MTLRFKMIAAVLGLAVATGAVADASANTVRKTVVLHHGAVTKTVKVVTHPLHRLRIGTRIVKSVRIVHRAPALVRVVKAPAPHRFVKTFTTKRIVRINRAPLQHHAMIHRIGGKTTIVR
jgi:hypothetical protein